jgi:hypothetical protein
MTDKKEVDHAERLGRLIGLKIITLGGLLLCVTLGFTNFQEHGFFVAAVLTLVYAMFGHTREILQQALTEHSDDAFKQLDRKMWFYELTSRLALPAVLEHMKTAQRLSDDDRRSIYRSAQEHAVFDIKVEDGAENATGILTSGPRLNLFGLDLQQASYLAIGVTMVWSVAIEALGYGLVIAAGYGISHLIPAV